METRIPSVTKLVQQSMQRLYPLALADRSWDNVGLLLEPPEYRPRTSMAPRVLLTIDLTPAVVDEALREDSRVETIVTYRFLPHPLSNSVRSYYIQSVEITYS